jgi:large subunit ribosomal protein L29
MKAKDIRAMSATDQAKEVEGLLREQFNLRMHKATGQLANTSRIGKVRRDIARLHTIIGEQARAGATQTGQTKVTKPKAIKAKKS